MKKARIHITAIKSRNKIVGKVSLEGELTIIHAHEIKVKLLEALENYQTLEVSVQKVTTIDLSCIQLLHALSKSTAEEKKSVTLDIRLSPEVGSLLIKAGFQMLLQDKNQSTQIQG